MGLKSSHGDNTTQCFDRRLSGTQLRMRAPSVPYALVPQSRVRSCCHAVSPRCRVSTLQIATRSLEMEVSWSDDRQTDKGRAADA